MGRASSSILVVPAASPRTGPPLTSDVATLVAPLLSAPVGIRYTALVVNASTRSPSGYDLRAEATLAALETGWWEWLLPDKASSAD
jgi:hypothetical protein